MENGFTSGRLYLPGRKGDRDARGLQGRVGKMVGFLQQADKVTSEK
jgi:hypothetical protein